jgi:hypothetical protein
MVGALTMILIGVLVVALLESPEWAPAPEPAAETST